MVENISKSFSDKAGLPPGTLMHVGDQSPHKTKITKIEYSENFIEEIKNVLVDDIISINKSKNNIWINISGLKDIEIVGKIGENFDIHRLVLEDILNTDHRPKIQEFDEYTFFTFKMLRFNNQKKIISEQISIILGQNFVLTFQEVEGDTFDAVRKRLNNKLGKIRTQGTDYLLYALIDTVIDNYFTIIEILNDNIQNLEDQIITEPDNDLIVKIQNYKKDLIFLRKIISPLRDSVGFLSKSATQLITIDTKLYFNDTLDHIIQINESINEMRDNLSTQLDIFLSNLSHQMNAVMKVLTIIATIFIPLTFIAGIYGMNFQIMPELEWQWGYPIVLGLMFFIFIGMLVYFKRKKWI
jgi:magnesium transporter